MNPNTFRTAFFMASRSMLRGNFKVLWMVVGIMCLVYLNLLFTPSLVEGLVAKTNQQVINTYSSHVVVESGGEHSELNRVKELTQDIEKVPGVQAVADKSSLSGEIRYRGKFGTWEINAVDPVREQQVFTIKPALIEGTFLEPGDTDQIVIGVQIAGAGQQNLELYADSLQTVHVGDKVEVKYGKNQRRQYTVKGILAFDFIRSDIRAYITQGELESLNPLAVNTATSVHIKLDDSRPVDQVAQELSYLRSNLRFSTWQDKAGVIRNLTDSFRKINNILTVLSLAVAIITILIVTYIDILDHRQQIGLKRAIGISSGVIVLSYVMRATVYAVVGVAISWLAFRYAVVPFVLSRPFSFPTGEVVLLYSWKLVVSNALILAFVVIFSAFVAALQVSKLSLLEAIWGE